MAKPDTENSFIYNKPRLLEFNFGQQVNGDDETVTFPTTNRISENQDGGSDSHAGAIAAGVIVPLLILLIIGAIIYFWYRKKYPVRMIFGKDFGKFSNPSYEKRVSTLTLTREEPFEEAYKKDIEKFAASQEVSTQDENIDYINEQQYQPTNVSFIQRISSSDFPGHSPEVDKKQYKETDEKESNKTNIKSKILNKVKGSQKSLNDKNETGNAEEEENARQTENNMIENAEQMIAGMKKKIIPLDAGSESSNTSSESQDKQQTSVKVSTEQQEISDSGSSEEEDKKDSEESPRIGQKKKIMVDKELVSDQDTPKVTNDLQMSESYVIADVNTTSGNKLGSSDNEDKVGDTDTVDAKNENVEDNTANQVDIKEIDTEDSTAVKDIAQEKVNIDGIPESVHEVEVKETFDAVKISEFQSSGPSLQDNENSKISEDQNDTCKLHNLNGNEDYDNQKELTVNNEQKDNKNIGLVTVSGKDGDTLTSSQFTTFPTDAVKEDLHSDPVLLATTGIQADGNVSDGILLSGNQNINDKIISFDGSSYSEGNSFHASISTHEENNKARISVEDKTAVPDASSSDDSSLSESQFEIIQTDDYILRSDDNNDTFQKSSKQSPLSEEGIEHATAIISNTANEQNIVDFNSEKQNTSETISDESNSLHLNSVEEKFVQLNLNDGSDIREVSRDPTSQFNLSNQILKPDGNNDIIQFDADQQSNSTLLFGANEEDGIERNSNDQNVRLYENVNENDNLVSSSFKPFADEVDFGEATDLDLTKNISFENKHFSVFEQKNVHSNDNDSIASSSSASSYSDRLMTRKEDTDSLNNFGRFGSFEILNKEDDNDSSSIGDASLKNFSSLSSDTDKEGDNMDQNDSKAYDDKRDNISMDNSTFDVGMVLKPADKNGGSATDLTEGSLNKIKVEGFPVESPGIDTHTPWIQDTNANSRALRSRESITEDNPFFDVEETKIDDSDKNSFVFIDSRNSFPETGAGDTGALTKELQKLDIESDFGKPSEQNESLKPLAEQEARPMKKITFNLSEINDSDVTSSDDESDSDSSNDVGGSYSIQDGDDADDAQKDSSEA